MKKVILFIPLLFLTQIICGQNLRIKLNNRTGFDLDSVSFGDKYFGVIKKDSSIIFFDCPEIKFVDGEYAGKRTGVIVGKVKAERQIIRCGTHTSEKVEPKGDFEFNISLYTAPSGYRLLWNKYK